MSDTGYVDPGAPAAPSYSPGLLPSVAQAYQNDPRRALIAALMQQSQQAQRRTLYSPISALASALPGIAGAATGAYVNDQYADANKGAQDTMRQGLAALTGGTDPATGQYTPGDSNKAASILGQNQYTAQQGFGIAEKNAMLRAQLANSLAEHNKFLGPNGISLIPGSAQAEHDLSAATSGGSTSGANTANAGLDGNVGQAAVIAAKAPAEASAAALKDQAENPALIARAGGSALAQLPADFAKMSYQGKVSVVTDLLKVTSNRYTGENLVPLLDPATKQKLVDLGVNPDDVLHGLGGGAPGASTPAPPPGVGAPSPATPLGAELLLKRANGGAAAPPPASAQPSQTVGSNLLVPQVAKALEQPAATPPAAAAPNTTGQNAGRTAFNGKNPMDEIPNSPLPDSTLPRTAATLSPGQDQALLATVKDYAAGAQKEYDTAVAPQAKQAVTDMAHIGSMRSLLQNGGVNTGATAPARQTIASWLAGSGIDPGTVQRLTGEAPADVQAFESIATQKGLAFARATEGAREAVQGINIALGSNPSLDKLKDANLKILDLMDASNKHALDEQQYSQAWFDKNKHYGGATAWFNQNHPEDEYTSKVIPYQLPKDPSALQPNVTYQGPKGVAQWNGQHFIPVGQQ